MSQLRRNLGDDMMVRGQARYAATATLAVMVDRPSSSMDNS